MARVVCIFEHCVGIPGLCRHLPSIARILWDLLVCPVFVSFVMVEHCHCLSGSYLSRNWQSWIWWSGSWQIERWWSGCWFAKVDRLGVDCSGVDGLGVEINNIHSVYWPNCMQYKARQYIFAWSLLSPAVYCNWTVLAELFLRLVHLADEVYEPFARLRNALFRPVGEMELSHRSRLAVLKKKWLLKRHKYEMQAFSGEKMVG